MVIRGGRLLDLSGKHKASYIAAIIESALLWGVLLYAASSRRGVLRWLSAAVFVILAALAVGGQLYFHRQYATYLNLDATLFATSFTESLFSQIRADGYYFLASLLPPIAFAAALIWAARSIVRPGGTRISKAARWLMPIVVCAAFLIPCSYRTVQASTPDVIYLHAVGGLIKELVGTRTTAQVRPGLRTPPKLEPIKPKPLSSIRGTKAPHRNVLFILTESVRADMVCSERADNCPTAPHTNLAVPGRIPLHQMRSTSSTTAIQLAVLWSGLPVTSSRADLHGFPLLFDYAKAAGYDNAYWTSHHMMFANSRLYVQDLPTSHQCGATDLDPLADIDLGARDDLLSARIQKDFDQLHEPFFVVAHYGNTHVPYRIDPKDAPFQPAVESKAPGDNEAYKNYYKNAVYLQDRFIADLIRHVRNSPMGERTVIVFTSDHGEAFREHGQLCHTGAVLDEEVHVPAWIDAPAGTLGEEELASLSALKHRPVFHTDITPTILDLMGILDEPSIASYRSQMPGQSLLRTGYSDKAVALSNCTEIWGCAFKNWGLMMGAKKLEGREWDKNWHCYDVIADPNEERDLGPDACTELKTLADKQYGGPPSAN